MRFPILKKAKHGKFHQVSIATITSILYSKISKLKVQDLNETFLLKSQRMTFLDFVDLQHLKTPELRNYRRPLQPLDIPGANMT